MFRGTLFDFQKEAVDRMVERGQLLVAYEMGLGKTILSIAAVERLIEDEEVMTGLVICPSSLKYQWFRQIEAFTGGDAKPIVIDGTPKQRAAQYERVKAGLHDYVIVNYEQLINDWEKVSRVRIDFVVADEVTAVKNPRAKRTKRLRRINPHYRFGLSGQPLENKAEELFAIMEWVDDSVLGRPDLFDKTFIVRDGFGNVKYYKQIPLLHKIVSDAMVRKTRSDPDVRDQMPKVTEQSRLIPFDSAGGSLYQRIAADLQKDLAEMVGTFGAFDLFAHYQGGSDNTAENQAKGKIMSKITCLKMLCDHPQLLTTSAQKFLSGTKEGSRYAADLKDAGLLDRKFGTPKFDVAMAEVLDILSASPSNKVVVFSFFKDTLGMIQKELSARGIGSVQFHGGMGAKAKDTAKQEFLTDKKCRVFLSSDAGGYGVDLPNANYLINYDLPWSMGKLEQRNARIIRLSTEWESVSLINTLMRGSIEERQYDMLAMKKLIASAVVDGKGADDKDRVEFDLTSLTDFLRDSSVTGLTPA